MNPDESPPAKALVPPRPNLGPELLIEPAIGLPELTAFAVVLLAVAFVGTWVFRRRTRGTRSGLGIEAAAAFDESPAGQVAVLAHRVRETLAARFGPQFRARTTEEIGQDDRLREALGTERMESLALLLQAADRCKFAPSRLPDDDATLESNLATWSALPKSLADDPAARPGLGLSLALPKDSRTQSPREGEAGMLESWS
ncbi:hypothetical protein [Aquisphaera insulae]|uniref:hypothetical protein n=1 Tax=Aquisphaera insulae TaxID=2712864 RepID=UPI0013EBF8FF|nr:hypothetical protein [Aquisphaera insulae]